MKIFKNKAASQPISSGDKPRIMVYIDGLNLYYSILRLRNNGLKWLDLGKFVDFAVSSYAPLSQGNVVKIKYFTTLVMGPEEKRRQQIYIKALEESCEKIEIIYGRFIEKSRRCRKCGDKHVAYEEKETDVLLACELLQDAYEGKMDMVLIFSGDGDFIPPVKILTQKRITVIVARMPKQRGFDLEKSASGAMRITERSIKKCILPDPAGGISKPPEWSS